jgi:hypothetical protein
MPIISKQAARNLVEAYTMYQVITKDSVECSCCYTKHDSLFVSKYEAHQYAKSLPNAFAIVKVPVQQYI